MKIMSIETSCDETAVSIVEATDEKNPKFKVLSNALFSQAKLHEEFGGVFPNLARREHQKNLVPLFLKTLKKVEPNFSESRINNLESRKLRTKSRKLKVLLAREPELLKQFEKHILNLKNPGIDKIAVTAGPGLEVALWVGISFAKALSVLWKIPVIPVNHMQGHFLAPLAEGKSIEFPALGLLISGGHTEIVNAKSPTSYKIIGQTLDDACGEAYDKVARILSLPYPGGPVVAKLAKEARQNFITHHSTINTSYTLPRPMINSKNLSFSFSGLKTAVLYLVKKIQDSEFNIPDSVRSQIAHEFEEAVKDVLVSKTKLAILQNPKAKTLVLGGGVSANDYIKKSLEVLAKANKLKFICASKALATDNAVMIAIAGFYSKTKPLSKIKANGTLTF